MSFVVSLCSIISLPLFVVLTTTWPMMKSQCCGMFYFAWNFRGQKGKKKRCWSNFHFC